MKKFISRKRVVSIIHNFILHERIDPSWINNKTEKLINEKNSAYKSYCHFNRDDFLSKNSKFCKTNSIRQLRILSKGTNLICQVN